jgi:hypothetical protein
MKRFSNPILITLGVVLLVAGSIAFFFWNQTFRISSVSPNPAPYSVTQIEFTFSKELDPSYDLKKISLSNQAVKGEYKLLKQSIVFVPADTLPEGKLTFSFPAIRSTTGEQMNANATVTVKYVPANQLSKDEKARRSERDNFQTDYPITSGYVPHATAAWKVEFILPSETGSDKLTLVVTPFIDRGTREPEVDYIARLDEIHKEFVTYIKAGGFTLSDYYIVYANSYLSRYDQSDPNGQVGD